ncbi:Wzz/FepE/Etk N-terminal domain-containing protein [Pseudomonas asiatica]|uniref:Wzz/FepE/Etk N-terminal domain-containing protein n=1 Tax=Pseudomonas asiatica TaxID=2219225 RepID=UPI003839FB66
MTIIASPSPASNHAEVDLLSVLRSLVRQKYLIMAGALLGTLIAGGYAFSVPSEYKVSTVLTTVALNDFDELNRSKIYNLTPKSALQRVAASLDSYDTRLGYFRSNPELQAAFEREGRTLEQAFEEFNSKSLKVVQPDPKKTDRVANYIGVDLRYLADLDGKAVLNGLVQYAINSERQILAKDLEVIVANRIREVDAKLDAARIDYQANKDGKIAKLLEGDAVKRAILTDELRALRLQLKLQRDNRIAELSEAITIARSLGLKRPSTPAAMGQAGVESSGNIIRTEIINQRIPSYFLGTDALEAERQALLKRTSDDFADPRVAEIRKELAMLETNRKIQMLNSRKNEELFLEGIEALRAERARLTAFNVNTDNLRMVTVDRYPVDPLSAVFPNKPLILMLGALIGITLGIFIALVKLLASPLRQVYEVDLNSIPQLPEARVNTSLAGQ